MTKGNGDLQMTNLRMVHSSNNLGVEVVPHRTLQGMGFLFWMEVWLIF